MEGFQFNKLEDSHSVTDYSLSNIRYTNIGTIDLEGIHLSKEEYLKKICKGCGMTYKEHGLFVTSYGPWRICFGEWIVCWSDGIIGPTSEEQFKREYTLV